MGLASELSFDEINLATFNSIEEPDSPVATVDFNVIKGVNMSKVNVRSEKQRQVTTRLSLSEYSAMSLEAEARGTTVAGVLRQAWSQYHEESRLKEDLKRLEKRLIRKMFEVCSATIGLDEDERRAAMNELNTKFKERAKDES